MVRLLAGSSGTGLSGCTPPMTKSITRFLNVFEAVNREVPFEGLRWFFDHAETISERNIERVKAAKAAASPCSTAWPSRANTSSTATVSRRRNSPRRFAECWGWACRSGRAPTRPAWRATTRSYRCTGWSRARRWAARRCTPRRTDWTARKPCAATPSASAWFSSEEDPQRLSGGRQAGGRRGTLRGLFFRARGGNQAHRVGTYRRRGQGGVRRRGVRAAGTAAPAGQSRLVAGQGVRRLPPGTCRPTRRPLVRATWPAAPTPPYGRRRYAGWPRFAGGRWGCRVSVSPFDQSGRLIHASGGSVRLVAAFATTRVNVPAFWRTRLPTDPDTTTGCVYQGSARLSLIWMQVLTQASSWRTP